MAASSYYSTVQKAYIAFYGRPADTAGLTYWAGRIDAAGGNISSIIQAFGTSAEATALYGSLGNAAAVNALFNQIFGRDADITGLNFYVGKLLDGSYTLVDVAQRVIDGASGNDATIVANKLTAAQSFTDAIDTAAEVVGYAGDTAAEAARAWLGTVGSTTASLTAAQGTVAATLSTISETGGSQATTTALSADVDDVSGTSGNDRFTGVVSGSATFNTGDIIDGGNGNDTLYLLGNTSDQAVVSLNDVETVELRLLVDGTYNAVDWSGVETVKVLSTSLTETDLTLSNLAASTKVEINGKQHDASITYLGASASSVSLGVNNAGSATSDLSVFTLGGATGTVANITLAASGTNFVQIDATAGATGLTINGAGTLYVSAIEKSVQTVNASGFAGALTLAFNTGADVTVTGGASADVFNFGAAGGLTDADTVNGGAGNDTLITTLSQTTNIGNVTKVEVLKANLDTSSIIINASGSDFTRAEFSADQAVALSLRNFGGSAIQLSDDSLNGVSVDMVAGAALNVNAGSADNTNSQDYGSLTISDASAVTITAVGTATNTLTFGNLTLDADAKSLVINQAGGSATMAFSNLSGSGLTSVAITNSGSGDVTFANSDANPFSEIDSLTSLTITANGGESGDVTFGATANIGVGSGASNLTVTLNADNASDITFGGFEIATAGQASLSITAGSGSDIGGYAGTGIYVVGAGTGANLSAITIDAGQNANVTMAGLEFGASGTVGDISVTGASAADVAFGTAYVESIGDVTVTTGKAGSFKINNQWTGERIGAISITGATATIGALSFSSLESITFSGSALSIGAIDATGSIGDITVAAADGLSITSINANELGNITVTGTATTVSIGTMSANVIGTINTTGIVGSAASVTINLSDIATDVTVRLGSATNTVTTGEGDDTIYLSSGTAEGANYIKYYTAGNGGDTIHNFELGANGDTLVVSGTGMALVATDGTAGGTAYLATADGITTIASGSYAVTGAWTANDLIVITATAYNNAQSLITALATGGAIALNNGTAAATGEGNILVLWTDNTNTYLSVIDATANAADSKSWVSMAATGTIETLATLYGIDRADLESFNAANIKFQI